MSSMAANLEAIQARIARAAEASGRSSGDVTIIAVTKTVSVQRILEAYGAGLRDFGENRLQEALSKFEVRPLSSGYDAVEGEAKVHREDIILHMIGSLQRNKAPIAATFFDMVHSLDRIELAVALESASEKAHMGRASDARTALPVLIEVNVTGELSKSGVAASDLNQLAEVVSRSRHLRGVGLMTIAQQGASEREARRTFAHLRQLRDELQQVYPGDWHHLSMGMSDDYEHAVRAGATMIRLGRALFGDRLA